jgi:hypothetical protein
MLRSMDDAEDLVQETYLRAWRSLDSFEGRSSLCTWLHQIDQREACWPCSLPRVNSPGIVNLVHIDV